MNKVVPIGDSLLKREECSPHWIGARPQGVNSSEWKERMYRYFISIRSCHTREQAAGKLSHLSFMMAGAHSAYWSKLICNNRRQWICCRIWSGGRESDRLLLTEWYTLSCITDKIRLINKRTLSNEESRKRSPTHSHLNSNHGSLSFAPSHSVQTSSCW